jgi:hypothetical protein
MPGPLQAYVLGVAHGMRLLGCCTNSSPYVHACQPGAIYRWGAAGSFDWPLSMEATMEATI